MSKRKPVKETADEVIESAPVEVPVKETRSKRQIIIDTVNEGGATIESLAVAADCKYASVMSNFSMLRLMGMHPIKDVPIEQEEGDPILTYRFASSKEAAALKQAALEKAATKVRVPKKSPAERFAAAEKRLGRCTKADKTADGRLASNPESKVLELKRAKAAIELELAQIEFAEAEAEAGLPVVVEESTAE